MKNVAYRIKIIRKALNLTQEQFGKEIGVGRSYIAQIEGEKTKPSNQFILKILKVFQLDKHIFNCSDTDFASIMENSVFDIINVEYSNSDQDKLHECISMTKELQSILSNIMKVLHISLIQYDISLSNEEIIRLKKIDNLSSRKMLNYLLSELGNGEAIRDLHFSISEGKDIYKELKTNISLANQLLDGYLYRLFDTGFLKTNSNEEKFDNINTFLNDKF